MLPIELSKADLDAVKMMKNSQSCERVRNRLWVLWFLHEGFKRKDVARLAGCAPNTVTLCVKTYNEGGIDAILTPLVTETAVVDRHFLGKDFDKVREGLIEECIHTVRHAQSFLEKKFGYQASWESTRRLLHRLGLRFRKVNPFPGNVKKFDEWVLKQKEWIEHLHGLHKQALNSKIDLVFCDSVHFVYGQFSSYLWSDSAKYKSTGSGRYRFNVYGAYDPVSNSLVSHYGEESVDADFVTGFMTWLRKEHYPDQSRPLHFILDNARYQHCQYVKDVAATLNIILEFQPSYSPNLNLIERAWKYIKKLVGRSYYATKQEFFQTIVHILENTSEEEHQQNFDTLLTMNFQTYEKSQILGG
ncbi:IS630 family transposase [Neolewinella lacunae]|uniref:IS630 family transposase n=1 Tax=Neolewinella lacunae TaxID=1517758 RepID=A0A923PK95_9BACT|nr:IS630 family transposase [Neolewinella lacunae]MBC6994904.1 IS630 family transposase [Neolewinella lacunae]MDN3635409.1 IS630 family transposase [Neolewinella lacunae]